VFSGRAHLPGVDVTTVAAERIDRLAALAREAQREGHPDRAREYVRRARRIAERNRLRLPRRVRRFTCDRCDSPLLPGRNARVRTQDGHVVFTCDCGEMARYPYRDGG
jgi:ribonuclease P protein subunit RPR2